MRLPDIMELEKFGFYAGFCTSASICTKLTLSFMSIHLLFPQPLYKAHCLSSSF